VARFYLCGVFLQVFCGKIPKDVLEDELIPLFEQCGTIWDLRLMMDPTTKQCRSFAFVTFVDKSSVDSAVKQVCYLCCWDFL
jgi:RNA recognition motif-containing protein